MATDETEHQPRATTASIDRRVERLEIAQTEMDRKVAALDVKVDYIRQFMELRFSTLEASLGATGAKLDAFMAKIDTMTQDNMQKQADLDASPLGRQVSKRLSDLEEQADKAAGFMTTARGLGYIISAYVVPAVAVTISTLALLRSFGAF